MIQGYGAVTQALLGTLLTWGLTAAGAACVFFIRGKHRKLLDVSLGFAAGVMTAASYWSLLEPAIQMCEESGFYGDKGQYAFVPVAVGFLFGAIFVFATDRSLDYLGINSTNMMINMVAIAPALFVNHGGDPMPLLGDKESIGLTRFLKGEVNKYVNLKELKAIILVTAHWEENKVTISSSEHHDLCFDYYGFPPEIYKFRYVARGDPELAKRIQEALTKAGIDSKLDPKSGWDHGVFVPMIPINPDADIPIIQVSVLSNQDPEEHYRIGQVLYQFRKEGIPIFGSIPEPYHNMREFRFSRYSGKDVNEDFDAFLHRACTSTDEKRKELLTVWESQPGANEAHPAHAAEHLMPLIVIAGAGGAGPAERVFNCDLAESFRLSGFIWKNE